jgi:hypothetical protein
MEEKRTTLEQLRFADELRLGVFLVERRREETLEIALTVQGKPARGEVAIDATARRYCGVTAKGAPQCTDWIKTACAGHDGSGEADLAHDSGRVVVEKRRGTMADCPGEALAPGAYRLFDEEAAPPALPREEDAEPLSIKELFGPLLSTRQYCRSVPTFYDVGLAGDDETAEAPPACLRKRSGWRRVPFTGHAGPFRGVELIRVGTTLAGAKIEHCVVALRTGRGWFFAHQSYHCAGVLGPSSSARIETQKIAVAGERNNEVLAIVFDEIRTTVSYRHRARDYLDPWSMTPVPRAFPVLKVGMRQDRHPGRPKAVEETARTRWLKLCGLGPSGTPGCTGDIPLGCARPNPATWSFERGTLVIEHRAGGGQDDESTCFDAEPLEPNRYDLRFP